MEFLDIAHYIVRLSGILITAGLILEIYCIILLWYLLQKRKKHEWNNEKRLDIQIKGQFALALGVIFQAIGILTQNYIGINIGGVWIIGRAIELTGDAFPLGFFIGFSLGILLVWIIHTRDKPKKNKSPEP